MSKIIPKDVQRGSLTQQQVESLEEILTRHHGERVLPVSRYCMRLREYSQALDNLVKKDKEGDYGPFHSKEELATANEGFALVCNWAEKSNLLGRLLYGDTPLRKEECPVHKGRWSGCQWPTPTCGCDDGSNVTGWLKDETAYSTSDD